MQPEMTIEKTTAVIGADAPERCFVDFNKTSNEQNVNRAISIVRSANEEQMEQILEILFS